MCNSCIGSCIHVHMKLWFLYFHHEFSCRIRFFIRTYSIIRKVIDFSSEPIPSSKSSKSGSSCTGGTLSFSLYLNQVSTLNLELKRSKFRMHIHEVVVALCKISVICENILHSHNLFFNIYLDFSCLRLWIICHVVANLLFNQWLIDWLFSVLRPAQEYFTYMETSPLPVKGCKI
jgi:hypothetical protein